MTLSSRILTLSFLLLAPVCAQDKYAAARLEDADEDFSYQGEYCGATREGNSICRCMGLQVIARGSGQFEAVAHLGGLPGAARIDETVKLQGERRNDVLELTGETLRARIQNERATLFTNEGELLGSFTKVRRKSPTLGMTPPAHAIVLFDGTNTDKFRNGKMTDDGLLKEGTAFKQLFEDFTLHLEFQLAYMPYLKGQKRSNSGVYIHSRYEVQVLDSFGLEGVKNECGALYRYRRPDVNMCLPPLSWQTYDITFRAARFDDAGHKTQNARVTVVHNGVKIHDDFELEHKTGAGKKETPKLFPTLLQNHSDPVRFRNIWIVDQTEASRRGTLARMEPQIAPKKQPVALSIPNGFAKPANVGQQPPLVVPSAQTPNLATALPKLPAQPVQTKRITAMKPVLPRTSAKHYRNATGPNAAEAAFGFAFPTASSAKTQRIARDVRNNR